MEISKTLWIIRGLPGSGKSTLAQILASIFHTDDWYEADMYFNDNGRYVFDPKKLGFAHDWCNLKVIKAMEAGHQHVIVSNTFTQMWEMKPYLEAAKVLGYKVQVIECKGQFGSVHNVPNPNIQRMMQRWEDYQPQ